MILTCYHRADEFPVRPSKALQFIGGARNLGEIYNFLPDNVKMSAIYKDGERFLTILKDDILYGLEHGGYVVKSKEGNISIFSIENFHKTFFVS